MGLSPRSLAHALRLNVESPRLRLRRTESGARALHFEAPPAREAPRMAEAEPQADAPATPEEAPAPGRRRFIDDAEEVGWRQGLVRAARDGLEHYIPDAKRAPLFEEAFGPLESVRVMGETGFEDLPALRLTPDVRGQVLRGRMRFGDKAPDAGRGGAGQTDDGFGDTIYYHGSNSAEQLTRFEAGRGGAVFVSPNRQHVRDLYALPTGGRDNVYEVRVRRGKHMATPEAMRSDIESGADEFAQLTPADRDVLLSWIEARRAGSPISNDWQMFERPEVRIWLQRNGYDSWSFVENSTHGNVGLFDGGNVRLANAAPDGGSLGPAIEGDVLPPGRDVVSRPPPSARQQMTPEQVKAGLRRVLGSMADEMEFQTGNIDAILAAPDIREVGGRYQLFNRETGETVLTLPEGAGFAEADRAVGAIVDAALANHQRASARIDFTPQRPNDGSAGDFPKFGPSGGPSKPGAGPYAIERAVRAAWGETGAALLDSGVLTVVRQPANMTGTVKIDGVDVALKDFADDIPDWVGAVHVGDKAILFADRLAPERVRYLVLHEIGVHYGLESMIGKRRYATLKRQAAARAAKAVAAARAARDAGAKEINPGDLFWLKVETRVRAHYDVNDPAYGDELLAYAAEDAEFQLKNFADNHPDRAWWQKILDAVRRWAGTQFGVGAITARDVHTLAVASLRRVGRMAADAQAEPIGPMAYVAVGDVMRFAEREGWDGQGGAAGARAFLESEGRAGAYERDYRKAPKPGSRGAANAAAATAAAGVAASSAVGAATAVKSNQNQAEARQAEYERLLAEDEARQEREAQQAAERAERERMQTILANRDLAALPDMTDRGDKPAREAYVRELSQWVSAMSGVDADFIFKLIARETAYTFDPDIANPASTAIGLGQFTKSTWATELKASGPDYNINTEGMSRDEVLALRTDPRIAGAMVGAHARANYEFMAERLGRDLSGADLYAAHFFGRDKAVEFLRAVDANMSADQMRRTFRASIFNAEGEEINASVFRDEAGNWRSARQINEAFEREFGGDQIALQPMAGAED